MLGPAVRDSYHATGVPASVTLAQAVLETGSGGNVLTRRQKNLFSIKGHGPGGYRKYNSWEESINDHAKLLRSSHYAKAMKYARDPDRYAKEIRRAGYATDPTYAMKLVHIMKKFNL